MSLHSIANQLKLNIDKHQCILREKLTTRQLRIAIASLTEHELSARSILEQGQTGHLAIETPYGVVKASKAGKSGRFWLWTLQFIPRIMHRTA